VNRRQFSSIPLPLMAAAILMAHQHARALTLGNLTQAEASQGLKVALEKGALAAVNLLGRPDGFLNNEKVRIPLPGYLDDAAKFLSMLGQGGRVEELITAMNRAAEAAVPMAKNLLVGAVKSMSVNDAKNILSGGDTSVTAFFTEKTRQPLAVQFLPIVTKATAKVGLADKYNQVAGKAASLGLLKKDEANIESYVTAKSLDGLYLMIGEEEKKIRQDPVGTGSALLKKVFGALN
jgi:hypothetical protein